MGTLLVSKAGSKGRDQMAAASQKPGKPDEIKALVDLARRAQLAGRIAEAESAYRKILALRPDIAEAYNGLANVLLSQGKLDEAAAQYTRALAVKPDLLQ